MSRFVLLWFTCDHDGCQVKTEHLFFWATRPDDPYPLPPGWTHGTSNTYDPPQDEFCVQDKVFCPDHKTTCPHVHGVTPVAKAAPYTIVCCQDTCPCGCGWQCIKSKDHDGPHRFGQVQHRDGWVAPEEQGSA